MVVENYSKITNSGQYEARGSGNQFKLLDSAGYEIPVSLDELDQLIIETLALGFEGDLYDLWHSIDSSFLILPLELLSHLIDLQTALTFYSRVNVFKVNNLEIGANDINEIISDVLSRSLNIDSLNGKSGYIGNMSQVSLNNDVAVKLIAEFCFINRAVIRKSKSALAISERELDVLIQVVGGLANKEIGDQLGMALPTVKEHVSKMLLKTGALDRVQLSALALGWLLDRVPQVES